MRQKDREFKSVPFYVKVSGRLALFTDPSTKGGGEKFTYQVPTYEALKGIIKSIYWKPTINWVIDSVKIMQPIQMETMGVRTLHDEREPKDRQDRSYYTYLRNPEYLIKCHFEWSDIDRLEEDRDKIKHTAIFKRSLDRGGRKTPFLGTSECKAYVEPITENEYLDAETPYHGTEMTLGLMHHSFDYHDHPDDEFEGITNRFAITNMKDGEITFPDLDNDNFITHKVNDVGVRRDYIIGENMKSVIDEHEDVFGEGDNKGE